MKQLSRRLLATVLCLSLLGCGSDAASGSVAASPTPSSTPTATPSPTPESTEKPTAETGNKESLDSIMEKLTSDTDETLTRIKNRYAEVKASINTYQEYKEHYQELADWYSMLESECETLYGRYDEYYEDYYRIAYENRSGLDESLDKIYETVYNGALDTIYNELYSGVLSDAYDDYYGGIVSDAYDELEYSEWSDASSKCYTDWSQGNEAFYRSWSSASSQFYALWATMCEGKYDSDKTFDELLTKGRAEQDKQAAKDERRHSQVEYTIEYEIRDGHAVVTGYSGDGNHATISSDYEKVPVTEIADGAFEGCEDLQSVLFWADIELIGDAAFKDCTSLAEISIPNETKTIGAHAFENCTNLTDLVVWGKPEIGEYAFANCVGISKFSFGSDTKVIGAHSFEGCTGLEDITIWGAEEIGAYAFAGCTKIQSVRIPRECAIIRTHAFAGCTELSELTIWGNDTIVEQGAFADCNKLKNPPAETEVQPETNTPEPAPEAAAEVTAEPESEPRTDNDIRPEFQQAMDSYVAFYEEYCAFLKTYSESDDPLKLLNQYSAYMTKLEKMDEAFDKLKDEEMNDAETKLYIDTNLKVQKMLLEAM